MSHGPARARRVPTPGVDTRSKDDDFFAGVYRRDGPAAGAAAPLRVPVFLESFEAIAAVYSADARALARLLPDARMRPVDVRPGRALFAAIGVHYRASDIGPYVELALAVPIAWATRVPATLDALRHGARRDFSAWIWQLPVSTERSRAAGVALSGFPKRVARLAFERDARQMRCSLLDEDDAGSPAVVLVAETDDDAAPSRRQLKLRAWSLLDGLPVMSTLVVRQTQFRDHLRRDKARLVLGHGALADELRALQLSERPLASHVCSQAQAMWFGPRNPIDD